MAHLLSPFLDLAARDPDRHWLTLIGNNGEESWSYGRMARMARGYAGYFQAAGVKPGDVVFIMAGTNGKAMAAFLGGMLIGAIPTLMPPLSPRQDSNLYWQSHVDLIALVKPALVLAEGDTFAVGSKRLGRQLIDLSTVDLETIYDGKPGRDDVVAFLQHSSGTTGLKKGVRITHTAADVQLRTYRDRLALSESDVIVSWLPLYHDMGLVACFLLAVFFCVPLVLIDPFLWVLQPKVFLEAIAARRGTLAWMPNFAFNHMARMLEGERFDLSSLRMLINCSEPCRPESMQRLCDTLQTSGISMDKLKVCYAMAETVFAVSQQLPGKSPRILGVDRRALEAQAVATDGNDLQLISAGVPLAGVKLRVVDDSFAPLPERHVGEIVIEAPFLFSGYNCLPEETARKLVEGSYRTGDRGFLLDGEVFVIGRLDDVIIVNGKKLDANEVEHALAGVDGLRRGRSVAFPVWHDQSGSHGLAVVLEAEPADTNAQRDLIRRVREHVYGCFAIAPNTIEIRPPGWLIKTTSGKINRKRNKLKYLEETGRAE